MEYAPDIIREAAQSTLGVLALIVLAIAVIALRMFHGSSEKTRLTVFSLMLLSAVAFGAAVFRAASDHATQPGLSSNYPSAARSPVPQPSTPRPVPDPAMPPAVGGDIRGEWRDQRNNTYRFTPTGGGGVLVEVTGPGGGRTLRGEGRIMLDGVGFSLEPDDAGIPWNYNLRFDSGGRRLTGDVNFGQTRGPFILTR